MRKKRKIKKYKRGRTRGIIGKIGSVYMRGATAKTAGKILL